MDHRLTNWSDRILSRRTFALGVASTLASILFLDRKGFGTAQVPKVAGDCTVEPGIELLGGFILGLPIMPIGELIPPVTWVTYADFDIGLAFTYPPEWSATTLWAERFTTSGMPVWTTRKPFLPALTNARLISPDGYAAFDAAVGTISGVLLDPLTAATIAEYGMVGESAKLTPICSYEDRVSLSPSWFRAMYVDDSVLVTDGYALPNPNALIPYTIVTYYGMLGPRAEFESLMRTVFLRILLQFSGGMGTPTPG